MHVGSLNAVLSLKLKKSTKGTRLSVYMEFVRFVLRYCKVEHRGLERCVQRGGI